MTGPVPTTYQRIWRLSADRTHLYARGATDISYNPVNPDPAAGIMTRIRGRSVFTPVSPPPDRSSLVFGTYKPDATTTGVFTGSTLTAQNAAITYSTAGQTITNMEFFEKVSTAAANITIKNSRFWGPLGPAPGPSLQCTSASNLNLVIEDCDITQQNPIWDSLAVKGHHVTLRRCNIYNVTDGFQHIGVGSSYQGLDQGITIEGCYIHDFAYCSPDPGGAGGLPDNASHLDGVQLRGGRNILIRGNNIQSFLDPALKEGGLLPVNLPSGTHVTGNKYKDVSDPSTQGTSCIMCSPILGELGNFVVKDNWFDGGAFMVNMAGHATVDTGVPNGIQFTGNRIGYGARPPAKGGGGPNSFIIAQAALPMTVTGNVRPDTGAAANYRANG